MVDLGPYKGVLACVVPTVVVSVNATPGDEVLIGPYVVLCLVDTACFNAIRADGVPFPCERLNMTEAQNKNVGMHYLNFITLNTTRLPECDSNCNACCVFFICFLDYAFVCTLYKFVLYIHAFSVWFVTSICLHNSTKPTTLYHTLLPMQLAERLWPAYLTIEYICWLA